MVVVQVLENVNTSEQGSYGRSASSSSVLRPEDIHKITSTKVIYFKVMVAGGSCVGKSTLVRLATELAQPSPTHGSQQDLNASHPSANAGSRADVALDGSRAAHGGHIAFSQSTREIEESRSVISLQTCAGTKAVVLTLVDTPAVHGNTIHNAQKQLQAMREYIELQLEEYQQALQQAQALSEAGNGWLITHYSLHCG